MGEQYTGGESASSAMPLNGGGWLAASGWLAIVLIAATGCRNGKALARAASATPRTVVVSVVEPQDTDLVRTTTQPATVHADQRAVIHSKAAGFVALLNADIGQVVAQGDVLAEISIPEMKKRELRQMAVIKRLEAEQRRSEAEHEVALQNVNSYEAQVDRAIADVAKWAAEVAAAQSEFDRISELVRQQSVAERLMDESQRKLDAADASQLAAEAAVASARADLALAQARAVAADAMNDVAAATTEESRRELEEIEALIAYGKIVAPFDGMVIERNVDEGDLVRNIQATSGDVPPLFVVAKVDRVRVRVPVPERDSPFVLPGAQATVVLPALGSEPIAGTVSRIAGALDEATRTMIVEIDLPNDDGRLLPGMFGQATIVAESNESRMVLPAGAVRYDAHGKSYVYVVDQSEQVRIVDVSTGHDDGHRIEIVAGLAGGERVIGPHLSRFKTGQSVTVQ